MATNSTGNSSSGGAQKHRFDPNFTQSVIGAIGPKASPRTRQIVSSLIQHVHDFARENELTVDEWMAGVQLVRRSRIGPLPPTKVYSP